MPSSQEKQRQGILADSDEDDTSSASSSVVEIVEPPTKKTKPADTPQKKRLYQAPPSSFSSGSSSNFRLTRVASTRKNAAPTTARRKEQMTLKRQRPSAFSAPSSSSSSSSSDSDDDDRRGVSQRGFRSLLNTSNKHKSANQLSESDSSSDGESALAAKVSKQPTRKKGNQKSKNATGTTEKSKYGNLSSDSEESSVDLAPRKKKPVVQPRTSTTTASASNSSQRVQPPAKQRKPPAQPVQRKPSAQPLQRKPPAQPMDKRNQGVSNRRSFSSDRSFPEKSPGAGSTTSHETLVLKHVAKKCAALRKEQQKADLDDGVAIFSSGSEAWGSSAKKKSPDDNDDETRSSTNSVVELGTPGGATQMPVAPSRLKAYNSKRSEFADLSDHDSDDSQEPDNANDDDDASVGTAELNKRLRTSLGLPIRPQDEPALPNPIDDKPRPWNNLNSPMDEHSLHSMRGARQPEEEFVLPPCDSSSSSSSSSSTKTCNERANATSNHSHYATPPIPSFIGLRQSQYRSSQVPVCMTETQNDNSQVTKLPEQYEDRTTVGAPAASAARMFRTSPAHAISRKNPPTQQWPSSSTYSLRESAVPASRPMSPPSARSYATGKAREAEEELDQHETREDGRNIRDQGFEKIFFDDDVDTARISGQEPTSHKSASFSSVAHPKHDRLDRLPNRQDDKEDLRRLQEQAFFDDGEPRSNPTFVDLCNDDEHDQANNCHDYSTIVHHGLRAPPSNQGMNHRALNFAARSQIHTTTEDIDYYSSDNDALPPSHMRLRRVTDTTNPHGRNAPLANIQPTMPPANYDANWQRGSNWTRTFQPPSGVQDANRSLLPQFQQPSQQQQPARLNKIRDSSKCNPFHARSVTTRKPRLHEEEPHLASRAARSTSGPILRTNDESVVYRQPINSSGPSRQQQSLQQFAGQQPVRNDLAGGSGVGAGSFSLHRSHAGDDDNESDNKYYHSSAPNRGRRNSTSGRGGKQSRTMPGTAKTKKGNYGRGKGGWASKRGRGGGGGRGKGKGKRASGGRGRRNHSSGFVMETQSDPLLNGVGGADFTL